MRQVLSTDCVKEPERLAYWHDVVCGVFVPLRVAMTKASGYRASLTQDVCGALQLATVSAESQVVQRTPRQAAADDESDQVFLGLQLSGPGTVAQDGRECRLSPGEAVLFDPSRPYTMGFAGRFSLAVFCLPMPLLAEAGADSARATARALRPLGAVASAALSYLSCVAAVSTSAGLTDEGLANGALGMAGALLRDASGEPAPPPAQEGIRERALAFIDLHLQDPTLSPVDVAGACHVSLRQLYRVFDSAGHTVAEDIRRRRLQRATALLQTLAGDTPVAWVGARVGFASPEHFTRAFRAAYGLPPAAWRAAHSRPPAPRGDVVAGPAHAGRAGPRV